MPPNRERLDFDQALKRLLIRAHDGFLELIAPDLTWVAERSPVLPAATRLAHLIWDVRDRDGRRGVLQVELQTKADPTIGGRLAEYAIRVWLQEQLPVRSVVVYLRETASVPASPFVISWGGQECLRLNYDAVRL